MLHRAQSLVLLSTVSISDIIIKFDLSYHWYADDKQLYVSIENYSNMYNLLAVLYQNMDAVQYA